MTRRLIIAGTDTGAGKTVFAAALSGALGAHYWKPIQCGLEGGGDRAVVAELSGLGADQILPNVYGLDMPASPHRAAEAQGVSIDPDSLGIPTVPGARAIVIEGAGGLLVPITRRLLQADLMARWQAPVVLVARTALGTINHTLLSLEALRSRDIPVLGVAFSGEEVADTERTIAEMGNVRRLGRLPPLAPLDRAGLAAAFDANFRREDFL